MSQEAHATRTAKPTTLGHLAYFMPLMPAMLTFGPMFMVMYTGSTIAIVAAIFLGIGLSLLWAGMMRVVQRLDAQDAAVVRET